MKDAWDASDWRSLSEALAAVHTIEGQALPFATIFADLRALPLREKAETALFIPQSNELYWQFSAVCSKVPFAAPALAGIALLDGLPRDCPLIFYGYWTYPPLPVPGPTATATTTETDTLALAGQSRVPELLCAAARRKGFARVIVLDAPSGNAPPLHTAALSCVQQHAAP
ncbi:MAG: hypothetical protein HC828_19440 [Blastochloris sp.]|nr:hypothetical protein [Blastochloris sp.]